MPSIMKRRFTPKKAVNYIVLALVAYLAYKVLIKQDNKTDPYGDRNWQHPRKVDLGDSDGVVKGDNSKHKVLRAEEEVVRADRKSAESKEEDARREKAKKELEELEHRIQMEREELKQELEEKRKERQRIDNLLKEEKRLLAEAGRKNLDLDEDAGPGPAVQRPEVKKKAPDPDPKKMDVSAMDKERERRRREFFKLVASNKVDFDETEETDFHERDDDFLNFVTALSPETFNGGLQLIHSVQRFFPKQSVGVYDLGLTKEQRNYLKTVCSVTLHELWLMAWPAHIQNATSSLWRPVLLQLALSEFGHFIYVEPQLVLKNANIKPYIQHSRRKGVVVVGKRKKYSSFVVTHPEMLFYLSVDVRKLQKLPHVEISMVLMHSTTTVRQRFMNLLIACTVEEWCISPIGSKRNCDHRLFAGSKKYADCHRYEESAINVLLKHWNLYQEDTYFARDVITTHYDGTDVRGSLRMCEMNPKKVDL